MQNFLQRYLTFIAIGMLIMLLTACGSTSPNTAETSQITDTGGVNAQIIQDNNNKIEATASVGINFDGSLDAEERKNAENDAFIAIVDKLISTKYTYLYDNNFAQNRDKINANIRDYILSSLITSENIDDRANIYRLSVRAEVNETRLLASIIPPAKNGKRTPMTFVFVARQDDGHGLPDDQREKKVKPTYDMLDEGELSATMRAVFVNNRLSPQDAGILSQETNSDFNPSAFRDEYSQGNRVSDTTIANAIRGLRALDDPIDFLAIGAVTVDRSFNDPVTGNMKVAVSVIGRVLDVRARGADVGAMEPTLYFGEGPTLLVARANAIKSAARESARVLTAQIRTYQSY